MNRQQKLDGQFAESEATRKIYLKRFELLESALSLLGFAEHVALWKIAIMVHRVAGQSGGVLEWPVASIAAEASVKCSYKTAGVAVRDLIEIGIFEVAGLVKEKCRGGKPFKAIRIDWPAVAKVINPPKKRSTQWVTEPVIKQEVEPVIELNIEPVISKPLISLQSTLPPPPTGSLTAEQLAAVAVLKNHLSDARLVEQLAIDHAEEVASVVADYKLNQELFRGTGAIKYRLQTGGWPTDAVVVTAEQHHRATIVAEKRRTREESERRVDHERQLRSSMLEAEFGDRLDSMSKGQVIEFGLKVLDEEFHSSLKMLPGVYRIELLEAMDFELSCQ